MPDVDLLYPYNFAPFPNQPPSKSSPAGHDSMSGKSGRLICTLQTLTPFLIKGEETSETNGESNRSPFVPIQEKGRPIIPGASLKGMVRSVFEVLTNSCVSASGDGRRLIPRAHDKCQARDRLCPACQVFGHVGAENENVHKGLINIGQGNIENRGDPLSVYHLPALYGPNITVPGSGNLNTRYYGTQQNPRGRKFYYHHHAFENDFPHAENRRSYAQPLGKGAQFQFTVQFEHLSSEQLAALVAALTLSDRAVTGGESVKVKHKLGYGKPVGLGSVDISIQKATLHLSPEERYRSFDSQPNELVGDNLSDWVHERQDLFFKEPTDPVKALAEILRYPPRENVNVTYQADPPPRL